MSLATLMYAGTGLLFRYVVREQDFWTTVFYQDLGAFLASIPLGIYMYQKSNFKKNLLRHRSVVNFIILSNIIAAVAILSQSVALSTTSAPRVYIIEGTQPMIMLIIAVISSLWFPNILKEDLAKETLSRKIFFSVLIFAGLFLIRS
jgi:drug/metabolite transporter (DMT)-like permease